MKTEDARGIADLTVAIMAPIMGDYGKELRGRIAALEVRLAQLEVEVEDDRANVEAQLANRT
jgi:hypothetical protein